MLWFIHFFIECVMCCRFHDVQRISHKLLLPLTLVINLSCLAPIVYGLRNAEA
jgi:hypothetical protein